MSKYKMPKGYSFFQLILNSRRFLNHPINFISESIEKFNGTYAVNLGFNRKVIVTQDVGFIQHVLKDNHRNYKKSPLATENIARYFRQGLLLTNDEYWLKQRRLIQPAFHKEKIKSLYDIILLSIEDSLKSFPVGEEVDVYIEANKIAFNIILKSIFDIKLSNEIMETLKTTFVELQHFLLEEINNPLQKIKNPFTGQKKKMLQKAAAMRGIFSKIIHDRKESKAPFADLLDMLLHTTYEDTGLPMEENQIIDELIILIFAGHETTANTIAWTLYLLSTHKDVLKKLTASIQNKTPQESLQNEYLQAVLNESMRFYPAVWVTERAAKEDDQFEDISFPKDSIIVSFFYGMHRDPKIWKDADSFIPDRFIENPALAKSKSFMPFGAGPRMCVGNNFAITEMFFFFHSFLQKFEIEATAHKPILKALITLRPDKILLKVGLAKP
jgi:cytochrome P450